MKRRIGNKMGSRKRTNRKSSKKIGGKRTNKKNRQRSYKKGSKRKPHKGGNIFKDGKDKILDTWKNISGKVETFFNFNKGDSNIKMMESEFNKLIN
jgi:hypothetical protein